MTGKQYQFVECECAGIAGETVNIPAGIWAVAEADSVSVVVGGRVLTLNSAAFQKLKLEHKAWLV